jgi:glycosyltransferase involved in cell wall biosynthesis
MRIGVDARELSGRTTGVGRYLAGLLREWGRSEGARRHEFVLYAPGEIAVRLDTRRFATRAVAGAGGTVWEQWQLPQAAAKDHLDVWFSPAYSLPLRLAVPAVVAIHDLSFVAHPEWFRMREGARRRFLVRQSAARARAIVTISRFSRDEIIERLGVAAGKIHVIPPGVGHSQSTGTNSQSEEGHQAANVLFVGSIFNRRHVPDLIRAFAPIARARPDASLDLVGDNRSHPYEDLVRTIAAEHLESQVRWHTYVADERLPALYQRARAFAFLSEYEGLGLPPLEALAAGVPPVLLDTPVARETCGEAALYVRHEDRGAITRALELALFSATARSQILAAAPGVLGKFNWSRAAAETLAVLESAARAGRA